MQTIFNDRMDIKKLRQKILDLAIHGKLVPQDPNDEPASVLLERIRAEKERLIKEGKIKRSKKSAKSSATPNSSAPQTAPRSHNGAYHKPCGKNGIKHFNSKLQLMIDSFLPTNWSFVTD